MSSTDWTLLWKAKRLVIGFWLCDLCHAHTKVLYALYPNCNYVIDDIGYITLKGACMKCMISRNPYRDKSYIGRYRDMHRVIKMYGETVIRNDLIIDVNNRSGMFQTCIQNQLPSRKL